jgi:4-amino-4-deoxy-L-arabinose transferase-like glycosyltransferase
MKLSAFKNAELSVFLASVVILILFWTLLPNSLRENESSDYLLFYEPVARNILHGRGFMLPGGEFALKYPPGYPVLLAGMFAIAKYTGVSETIAVAVFMSLCMGMSSVILYRFSVDIWGTRFTWITPLLFMTYPLVLWLVKQPNSEIPFMTSFYGCIYLYWLARSHQENKWIFYGLAGALAGVAMLIRPIAIGLGILLAVILLFSRDQTLMKRFLLSGVLIAGNILVILPWQALVFSNTGSAIPLSAGSVTSIRDGLTFAAATKNYRTDIKIPKDVASFQNEIVGKVSQMQTLGDVAVIMGKYLVEKPAVVIKLFLVKAARSWYASDSGRFEMPVLFAQIAYGFFMLTASVLAWRHCDRSHFPLILVGCVVVYFWLMTITVLSIVRYMVPAISLLFLFVPGTVQYLYDRLFPYRAVSLERP